MGKTIFYTRSINSLLDIQMQLKYLQEHVETSGEVQHISDEMVSGASLNRPGMQELLREMQMGNVSALYSTKVDRLTQRIEDLHHIVELLRKYHINYEALEDRIEIRDGDPLPDEILHVIANFERSLKSEAKYEESYQKAMRGEIRVKPCYGYYLHEGEYHINYDEAHWVRIGAEMLLNGRGTRDVAKHFNEHGVRGRHGKPWSDASVRTLYKNDALTGQLTWNKHKGSGKGRKQREESDWIVLKDHHTPILSQEEFDKINESFSQRSSHHAPRKGGRLLSKLAKCAYCGGNMQAGWMIYTTKNGEVRKKTYRCGTYAMKGTCQINTIEADELDQYVIHQLEKLVNGRMDDIEFVIESEDINALKNRLNRTQQQIERQASEDGLIMLEAERDKLTAKLERLETIQRMRKQEIIEEFRKKIPATTLYFEDKTELRELLLNVVYEVRVKNQDNTSPDVQIVFKLTV